jgi:hypothetical protein
LTLFLSQLVGFETSPASATAQCMFIRVPFARWNLNLALQKAEQPKRFQIVSKTRERPKLNN